MSDQFNLAKGEVRLRIKIVELKLTENYQIFKQVSLDQKNIYISEMCSGGNKYKYPRQTDAGLIKLLKVINSTLVPFVLKY